MLNMPTLSFFGKEVDIDSYTGEEKKQLLQMLADVEMKMLTVERILEYITRAKNAVIDEFHKTDRKDVDRRNILEARMINYSDLEIVLGTPNIEKKELLKRLEITEEVKGKVQVDRII